MHSEGSVPEGLVEPMASELASLTCVVVVSLMIRHKLMNSAHNDTLVFRGTVGSDVMACVNGFGPPIRHRTSHTYMHALKY